MNPFAALPLKSRLLAGTQVLRGVVALVCAETLLRRGRLLRACALLGVVPPGTQPTPKQCQSAPSPEQLASAERHAGLAFRLVRLEPTCLRRALVTGHLTRRFSPSLHISITRRDPFEAHAWLNYATASLEHGSTAAPGVLKPLGKRS